MAPAFYDSIVSFCQRAGFSPKVSHETDHLQTSLTLVASGLGVSLVPASIRALGLTGVDYRPLRPPVPYLDMGMAYRREDSSEVLRVFIDTVREVAKASAR
jgi:DNA-binding transcriptional LysR family regulator